MNWKTPENARLIKAILALKNSDDAQRFLRDLMTEREITEFAARFKAAEMLDAKKPYTEIEKVTGLSSATIARVAKWLKGSEGGYRVVIDSLHHNDTDSVA